MECRHSTSTTPTGSGSPKRTAVNNSTPSSPPKRSRPDGPAIDTRDSEFWYPDGTVVIRVHKTLFRVHGSRLARYCVYFQKLFEQSSEGADTAVLNEIIDGCPVYHVPAELSANEFRDVLKALDTPLEFTTKPPTQTLAISLLAASTSLSCARVHDLAVRRLCELWDATRPPPADPLDARKWSMAAYMVELARRHGIPGVLKRAYYELASSAAFWDAVQTDRDRDREAGTVRLPVGDVLMLYEARFELGRMWREWVMEPHMKKEEDGMPGGAMRVLTFRCLGGAMCGGYRLSGGWMERVKKYGLLEKDALDPLRYNVVRSAKEAFEGEYAWCESCKAEKEEAWKAKCAEWWGRLDGVFGL